MKLLAHIGLIASLGLASHAMASPLTFFGQDRGVFTQDGAPTGAGFANSMAARADFLSNLTGVGTESFESATVGTAAPLALTFPGAGTATLNGGGVVTNVPGTGQNATTGSNWWRTGAGNNFVITFDSPIAAFGFYGIDVGDVGAQLTLTLSSGSSIAIDIPHTVEAGGPGSGQNGSVIFFGYIDEANPWTSATFSNLGGGGADDFGFDDMTIGSIEQVNRTPEPGSLPLIAAAALAGFGLKRRRGQAGN